MKFKPEDFDELRVVLKDVLWDVLPEGKHRDLIFTLIHCVKLGARDAANVRLEQMLSEAPTVSGKMVGDNMASAWSSWSIRSYDDTHTAKLVGIEKIKK